MARCDQCGGRILFGGDNDGGRVYCGDSCRERGELVELTRKLPDAQVADLVAEFRGSDCPVCRGPGPVDLHFHHTVWSIVVLTTHRSTPRVSCRSCATKAQILSILSSGLFGWWGVPFGLLFTPIQIGKNIAGLLEPSPDPFVAPPRTENLVRLELGGRIVAAFEKDRAIG